MGSVPNMRIWGQLTCLEIKQRNKKKCCRLIHLANVELPNVELPYVELLNVELPNAKLPNVELPNAESYPTSNITQRRILENVL